MNRSLSSTGDVSFQGKVTSLPEVSPMSLDKNVTRRPISAKRSVTDVSSEQPRTSFTRQTKEILYISAG
jgi:hypothetical protein